MKATWLGHAAVLLEGSRVVLLDPFLTGNPKAARGAADVKKADLVVVTHDHVDHLGDAHDIAKRTGAVLVGMHEVAVAAAEAGVPRTEGMNVGGSVEARGVRVHMTTAQHSGGAAGIVVEFDGKRVYHAGDTGLFSDMRLIAECLGPFDLAFLPIGDRYTMGPPSAARAVAYLKPRVVVPIHYGTWPPIESDPADFARRVGADARVEVLAPGGAVEI